MWPGCVERIPCRRSSRRISRPMMGSPSGLIVMVMATMAPSSPAAYCRTAPEPFAGGGPGSYVDFSMFCFHMPISRSARAGPCATRTLEQAIAVTPTTTVKPRFIETSRARAARSRNDQSTRNANKRRRSIRMWESQAGWWRVTMASTNSPSPARRAGSEAAVNRRTSKLTYLLRLRAVPVNPSGGGPDRPDGRL